MPVGEIITGVAAIAIGLLIAVRSRETGHDLHKQTNTGSPEAYALAFHLGGLALAAGSLLVMIVTSLRR